MDRDERCAVLSRIGEDRLSATLAAIVLAANLFGGGVLALFKVLDVPPLVSGSPGTSETMTASAGAIQPPDLRPGPIREQALRVARFGPGTEIR